MSRTRTILNLQHLRPAPVRAALALLAVLGLGGCFASGNQPLGPKTELALPGQNSSISSLAVAQIDGMDEHTAQRLQTHMKSALARHRISLVNQPTAAAFSLKGYGSVINDAKSTTLVNIWDVHDIKGRKVHRIVSEESGPAGRAGSPWAGVNSTLLAKSAANLARQYANWSTGKKLVGPGGGAPAASEAPMATASIPLRKAPAKAAPARAATPVPAKAVFARVEGAPGTGNAELTAALKSALGRHGYGFAPQAAAAAHRVDVRVRLGTPESGRQPIAIDWKLSARNGRHIGTVRQRNSVTAGSLNRIWGENAKGAASAAAAQLVKLLH